MLTKYYIAIAMSVAGFGTAQAEGCGDYPYSTGINIEDVQGGTRILSTASVGVSFDDVDAVNDARDEATVSAKAMIAKLFQESVISDEEIRKAIQETKSMQGETKKVSRNEVIDRVKRLTNSSSALLTGVVPLGDCYTAGKEYRVSVGLKPETIAAAGAAANAMGKSIATRPTQRTASPLDPQTPSSPNPAPVSPSDRSNGVGGQPLNRVPGFSNTQTLKGF